VSINTAKNKSPPQRVLEYAGSLFFEYAGSLFVGGPIVRLLLLLVGRHDGRLRAPEKNLFPAELLFPAAVLLLVAVVKRGTAGSFPRRPPEAADDEAVVSGLMGAGVVQLGHLFL
jgi:hypothetical protein